jgi:hypothetical protein
MLEHRKHNIKENTTLNRAQTSGSNFGSHNLDLLVKTQCPKKNSKFAMFDNPNKNMFLHRSSKIDAWGKDSTALIEYEFDEYGFRKQNNYQKEPEHVFFGCSLLFGIGIETKNIFTNGLNCWNFGLAGSYTEQEIIECYKRFTELQIKSNIIFVWRDFNSTPKHILDNQEVHHFVPINSKSKNHTRLMENIDFDVSGTHWGIKTHTKFHKLLCNFLK